MKEYEEVIEEAVIFLVERDILDQTETAELINCFLLADNF
ncbi:hypothetical protein CAEBREN_22022 [Caenorhabditis brenneri]|uniref:Uncharacterized protein n=1 Tax=Caenorhabditis brenneri TaxID=135651 RepID=G0MBH9_CAEBE|nr:hypothetical protein CAEBREN_22022 [Caenorhabditis brenneri]